jgi:hypothetical protein
MAENLEKEYLPMPWTPASTLSAHRKIEIFLAFCAANAAGAPKS